MGEQFSIRLSENLSQGSQLSYDGIFIHGNCEMISICFAIICFAVIANILEARGQWNSSFCDIFIAVRNFSKRDSTEKRDEECTSELK